jgi:signal transduction histidine kinase
MLLSCKHLKLAPWILGANYPLSEANEPIAKAKKYFVISVISATAMLLLINWLIMRRLMLPLADITRHLKQLPERPYHEHQIQIDSEDEIGVLATAFNTMIDTMNRQHSELHQQTLLLEQEISVRQVAQEELSTKQLQLEWVNSLLKEMNNNLEERISQAVSENRLKDRILIQQSRQADLGEMINNIAHQWKQPLNTIGLITQGFMYYGELTKEMLKADVDRMMNTLQYMSQTIDDFRDYFKPDKTKVAFSIKMMIKRTLSIIEGSLGSIQIIFDADSADDVIITGYPNEYSQVVLNILLNAKDVMIERNISNPEIRIAICSEHDKSIVTIRDNAGGIAVDIIDRIFDPYFSTKGPDKGTGIGLYMSKNIIEGNMMGRLTVQNVEGGAEFRIEV